MLKRLVLFSGLFLASISAFGATSINENTFPFLRYSSFLGGSDEDEISGITVDQDGNIIVVGDTQSDDFPVLNAIQPHRVKTLCGSSGNRFNCSDAFVSKFDPTGSRLIFSTYLGGSAEDAANAVSVDSAGNVYLTGYTDSSDFPVLRAIEPHQAGNRDAFVAKLSPSGRLLFSTFLGGRDEDTGIGIITDRKDCVYITGVTDSDNFPTAQALQPKSAGLADAFVTKLDSKGKIIFSTFLGGSDTDLVRSIAVSSTSEIYVTGFTFSLDFPLVHPIQTENLGQYGAFVSKIGASGTSFEYSTYLGGSGADEGLSVAVTPTGAAVIVGATTSSDFPTKNAFQKHYRDSQDAFVIRISPDGGSIVFSTYLGGGFADTAVAVAADKNGNAFVTGTTISPGFPVLNAFQKYKGGVGEDAFVIKLDRYGHPSWSSFLGGRFLDNGQAIVTTSNWAVYVAGRTNSTFFPLVNSFQKHKGGEFFSYDGFLSVIGLR